MAPADSLHCPVYIPGIQQRCLLEPPHNRRAHVTVIHHRKNKMPNKIQ